MPVFLFWLPLAAFWASIGCLWVGYDERRLPVILAAIWSSVFILYLLFGGLFFPFVAIQAILVVIALMKMKLETI